MKNIDSLIGKACVEYCEQVGSVYNEKDVFKAGSHFALSLFKWRKVSEELPKVEDNVAVPRLKFWIYNISMAASHIAVKLNLIETVLLST